MAFWDCEQGWILLTPRILLCGKGKHYEFDATTRHFFLEGSREVIKQFPACQAG